jgi:hypothetical protein
LRGQLSSSLLYSAITFRRCIPEKMGFVVLNCLDLLLTLFAINIGCQELNPVMRAALQYPGLLLVTKIALPAFVAWLVPGKWLLPAIALLAVVVGWDIKEIFLVLL